jgi:hypothetical protein
MTSLRISGAEEVLSTRVEMLERFESNASGLLDSGNALTSFELGLTNLDSLASKISKVENI